LPPFQKTNVVGSWEVHTTNKKENTASPKIQEYELGSASTITSIGTTLHVEKVR
jgi:hypothetical protein